MKRTILLLLFVFLLAGCETAPAQTDIVETGPPIPWVQALGQPWDAEGALLELPLDVPNGMIYTSHIIFDGDLLLWTQDNHRKDQVRTDICIVDLDTGKVLSQKEIPIGCTMMPQALGDMLYIVDSNSGTIVKLDKGLDQIQQWQADIHESSVYMAADGTAYVDSWEGESYALDLETGEERPILDADTEVSYLDNSFGYLKVVYYHPDSGEECVVFLDLETGERFDAPFKGNRGCEFWNGNFLLSGYEETFVYTLIPAEGGAVTVDLGHDNMELIDNGLILKNMNAGEQISIHDLSGRSLAQCSICEEGYSYEYFDLIPNETLGGYFLVLSNHGRGMRLLYWDTDKGQRGTDIAFAPVPEPSQQEAELQARVAQLEAEFGVDILIGEDAAGYFYDFAVQVVTDYEDIQDALDTLENALDDYPEGFFRQLRYGDIHSLKIHLMGAITATNSEYVDTYAAFVQDGFDSHVMVMDIYLSDEATYYHEFSHIIDSYLEWDAAEREDALFSEETWASLNPDWFPGYTWDYSWQQDVEDYGAFIDSYSTIKPTEDRARVLEYAMAEYGYWNFHEQEVLMNKLEYYCSCIRDAFDTTGWPEDLLWEQYLTE